MAGNNDRIRELIAGKGRPGGRTFTESEKMLIYESMAGLINKCANMWTNYGRAEYEDLTQEGYIGLSEAMQKYDADSPACFSSYATEWINCKMSLYSKKCSGIPVNKYTFVRAYRESVAKYREEYGRTPTEKELSEIMGVSVATLSDIINADKYLTPESIETTMPGTDIPLKETLQGSQDTAQELIEEAERNRVLYSILDELPGVQKAAVTAKYLDGKTVNETAKNMGVSVNQVRGSLSRGINALKRKKGRLMPYYDHWKIKSIAYKRSGFKAWQNEWESSVEYAAIKELQEQWERVKDLSFTG